LLQDLEPQDAMSDITDDDHQPEYRAESQQHAVRLRHLGRYLASS
jgi:hypothetical protein